METKFKFYRQKCPLYHDDEVLTEVYTGEGCELVSKSGTLWFREELNDGEIIMWQLNKFGYRLTTDRFWDNCFEEFEPNEKQLKKAKEVYDDFMKNVYEDIYGGNEQWLKKNGGCGKRQ